MIRPGYALFVLLAGFATVSAADVQDICNEMYPSESYDGHERNIYIQECIASYGGTAGSGYSDYQHDSQSSYQDQGYTGNSNEEPTYYEGTVEDYISQLPE